MRRYVTEKNLLREVTDFRPGAWVNLVTVSYTHLLSKMNENVCKAFTVDGQLVGVYRSRPIGRNGLGYRADWAEKLGLEEPKTIEDIYNMMYQFTYGDPDGNGKDDTYGLCMCKYTGPLDIIQA